MNMSMSKKKLKHKRTKMKKNKLIKIMIKSNQSRMKNNPSKIKSK